MGVSPKYWGKEAWKFIHWVALTYPTNPTPIDKKNYLKFFESLQDVLPCPFCAVHFKQNMTKNPIRLDNNMELFNWTVEMHNEVNRQNSKKIYTYEEALKEITNPKSYEDKSEKKDMFKGIVLSSALITIITLLSSQYTKK
jgi:hypothetical protein